MTNAKVGIRRVLISSAVLFTLFFSQSSFGQGLTDPRLIYANDVERASAEANQATYNLLRDRCDPLGSLDGIVNPDPPTSCNADEFTVYLQTRELVHSANELLGVGPIAASLGVDQEGLGTALRWTAAEELAVQGSMATEFSNSQLGNLAARLSALRFGATGFSVAGLYNPMQSDDMVVAQLEREQRGGGASADGAGESYSRWGGFINGSFGWGSKLPTGNEDAFDFDGSELTVGLDYRFSSSFVLGGIFGFSEQTVDFDEGASDILVVDGGVEADASSAILFGLYQGDRLAASASMGYQTLDYDVDRKIKYPSFNPDLDSANSTARSTPEADILTATIGLSYAFTAGRFTVEPYLNGEYRDVTIDRFSEERSIETLTGQPDDAAFNLTIAEQAFKSLDVAAGMKFQYVFTPRMGIIVPYAKIESHKEFEDKARVIRARYGLLDDSDGLPFAVTTDALDSSYYTWSAGFSMVLRGGRQRTADGPVTGGLMAFIQYTSIEDLENYEDQVIAGGFRYEF